jgi:hypothetical protein
VDAKYLAVDFVKVEKPGCFRFIGEQGQVGQNLLIGNRGLPEKAEEILAPGDLVTAVIVLRNASWLLSGGIPLLNSRSSCVRPGEWTAFSAAKTGAVNDEPHGE